MSENEKEFLFCKRFFLYNDRWHFLNAKWMMVFDNGEAEVELESFLEGHRRR
jgi:hypothetical protein